jgi:small subunit ribosomal protein S20
MAITKSAKKSHKRSIKLAARNSVVKEAMKAAIRKLRQMISKGEKVSAKDVSEAYSVIDKAVKINAIHKKNAQRKKSRLTKMVNAA